VLALCVLSTLAITGAPVRADTRSDLKAANNTLNDLITRIDTANAELDSLRGQISRLLAEVDANRRALEQTNAAIAAGTKETSGLQAQIDAAQAALNARAVQAYEQGPAQPLLAVLDATSFTDLQGRMDTLQEVANADDALIASLQARRASLAAARSNLQALQGRIDDVQAQLGQMVDALRTAVSMQEEALASLQSDKQEAKALVASLKAKRERELAEAALAKASVGVPLPGPPPPGTQAVQDMIVWDFTPLGQPNVDNALCVGYRESRYQADAVNVSSGASGVFQFMPFLWPIMSEAAGWAGASVFDAKANVAVAAWTVANYGWSPWNSDSGVCPI
jgi:peptidoglycan hydrolase CwlO-like protein